MRTVLPRPLEPDPYAAVGVLLESVERERWSRDVATQALEARSVATVERDLGVDIDPADLGKRTCTGWRNEAQRVGELCGPLPGCAAE